MWSGQDGFIKSKLRSTVGVWIHLAAACGSCEQWREKLTFNERSPQRSRRRAVDDEQRMNKPYRLREGRQIFLAFYRNQVADNALYYR